jgi:NADPH-dependent ferric siderophore reductase
MSDEERRNEAVRRDRRGARGIRDEAVGVDQFSPHRTLSPGQLSIEPVDVAHRAGRRCMVPRHLGHRCMYLLMDMLVHAPHAGPISSYSRELNILYT